jgi:hypothetical protein
VGSAAVPCLALGHGALRLFVRYSRPIGVRAWDLALCVLGHLAKSACSRILTLLGWLLAFEYREVQLGGHGSDAAAYHK